MDGERDEAAAETVLIDIRSNKNPASQKMRVGGIGKVDLGGFVSFGRKLS